MQYTEHSKLLNEYAGYKSVIQGCSPKTVDEYMIDLRTFFRYIKSRGKNLSDEEFEAIPVDDIDISFLAKITTMDIYAFLMYLEREKQNGWSARARKLSAIKGLYKYLTVKRSLLEENPAINIEAPKAQKKLPKHLSVNEAANLIIETKDNKDNKNALRDYTIITLFLNCGMRLSELVGLDIDRVDRELRSIVVLGKGSKERLIYLNDTCKKVLKEYLEFRFSPRFSNVNTKALFLSSRNQRISNATVQHLVKKHLNESGLGSKNYSTHKLRHTAATLMYQSGKVDVRTLKDILGHEQLNTTQIYTHVSNADMEEAMQKNPLNHIDKMTGGDTSSDDEQ